MSAEQALGPGVYLHSQGAHLSRLRSNITSSMKPSVMHVLAVEHVGVSVDCLSKALTSNGSLGSAALSGPFRATSNAHRVVCPTGRLEHRAMSWSSPLTQCLLNDAVLPQVRTLEKMTGSFQQNHPWTSICSLRRSWQETALSQCLKSPFTLSSLPCPLLPFWA